MLAQSIALSRATTAARLGGWLVALCLCLATSLAWGQAVPRDLAVLVDQEATLTIEDAASAALAGRYQPLTARLGAGYTRDVHWLRFTLDVPAPGEWWLEVQPPFLDDLRLYVPSAGGWVERRSGDTLPFSGREESYRAFVFKLDVYDARAQTYYLRVQTTSSSMVDLRLWEPARFQAAKRGEYAVFGFYFGFALLVLMFNLILWTWLRDALYGWFCLNILANLLLFFGADGFAAQYLFPATPAIPDVWVGAAVLLTMAASAPFYRRMLRVEKEQRFAFAVFRLQVIVPCLLLASLVTGHYPEAARIAMVQLLFSQFLTMTIAYRMWREGLHEAPYILLAVGASLLGGVSSAFSLLGIAPSDLPILEVRQFSILGNILAMHFALTLRIREMRAERAQSLQRAREAEADAAREREASAEQGRFIAMLSHELKTPLAVIDVAAQALERLDHPADPQRARRHERIRRSVNRIDRLVEQFLTKDRLDAKGMALQNGPVKLDSLLRQVIETSADGSERIRLALFACPPLDGDAALLRLAVANLVDNAVKYAPTETDIDITVMTRTENALPGVEIIVADHGPGVPPELRDHVFSRYRRGSNVGHMPGAGLGLYLVRRIAELHGGFAELNGQEDGAAFRIWLPLIEEQEGGRVTTKGDGS